MPFKSTEDCASSTADDATFSRRGLGKRLLLGASALAVLLAAEKSETAQAAPTTPWVLGGNAPLTDGTEYLGTKNVAPLIFKTAAAANTPLERMRITPTGNVGIGMTTPSAKLQVHSTTYAVFGRHSSASGSHPGVLGDTLATVAGASGVQGSVRSTAPGVNSAGLLGQNNGTNANGAGVRGTHAGGGYGVHASSVSGTGLYSSGSTAVDAQGSSTGVNAFGASYGVFGQTNTGTGVRGESLVNYPFAQGVYGEGKGVDNSGVVGRADNGSYAYAVWGLSAAGYAGYFQGKAHVTGTLSKGAGSFKIDHPLEPETKYLYHSFVESPDMMNVYNGKITLDENGEATVELPDWFEELNRDFRYQLTTIGSFAPVFVAETIKDNHIKIAGGTAGMEVSWMVTGIRQDAFANSSRIPVEEDKPAAERGKYLHPREHGKPESAGINAERVKKLNEKARR